MADIENKVETNNAVEAVKAETPKVTKAPKAVTPEEKHSKVMEVLRKEYAVENWLLAVLAPILLIWGVYIVSGSFGTIDLTSVLGSSGFGFIDFFFQTDLARIITGTVLIVIATLVVIYLLIPIVKPSFLEMKKVTWPTAKQLGSDSAKVFAFLLFLMAIFTLYGYALEPLFKWLYSL